MSSVDIEVINYCPPGLEGGLHATHGDDGRCLWYLAAVLSACGVKAEPGDRLRISVEVLERGGEERPTKICGLCGGDLDLEGRCSGDHVAIPLGQVDEEG